MKKTDVQLSKSRLKKQVSELTEAIGERSLGYPDNLERAANYIQKFYQKIGLAVWRESYHYHNLQVANIIARIEGQSPEPKHYILGAHYDSVSGTVGADDNASAVAVQMETARYLYQYQPLKNTISFVSFALEEPPVFGTRLMGSKVHVRGIKKRKERLDGMLCLEMVGYACYRPNCQHYPLGSKVLAVSEFGDFIVVLGDTGSRGLSRDIHKAFQNNPDLPVLKLNVPFKGVLFPPVRSSDHAPFWDAGYQAVMITDTAYYRNPNYHRASDTISTLDFNFMAEVLEGLVRFFVE